MTELESTGTHDQAATRRRFAMAGGLAVLAVTIGVGMFPAGHGSAGSTRPPLRDHSAQKLVDVLSRTIEARGIGAAVEQYRSLREQGFPGLYESESQTNSLGYKLLKRGELATAIEVLQLNVATHPESANVHDSLGEAYLAAGNTALAAESYQRAVAIDPRMKSAVSELQRLTNFKREPYRPIVLFHIVAGALGILSGTLAMSLRKGSRRHGVAGRVFVVSMLCMSASGAYRAFVAPDGEPLNILMGILTFYLVATSWLTARRRTGGTGPLDWIFMLVGTAVATGLLRQGMAEQRFGVVFFLFGAVAVLAAALDLRRIVRGGVFGAGRIARHLWRMCAALYIGVSSLFLGQPQVFPYAVRESGVLAVPSALVGILLVFWLVRVLFTKAYKRTASPKPRAATVGQALTT